MKLWEKYHTPKTLEEALLLLRDYAGQARVIAGGTDLLVDLHAAGGEPFPALVDITHIPDLNTIMEQGDTVLIGAGVTHNQIVRSPLLAARATCLVESCGVVGGPQVRNVATLGGNVAHALPAGDGTVSLVALDAEAEVVKDGERRWLPMRELYLGPGQSLLDSSRDLLLRFRVPLHGAQEASAFSRIMRPQGVALPILGCAVWLRLDESHSHYADVRVCIAPAGPTPARALEVEQVLKKQPVGAAAVAQAVQAAYDSLRLRTSKYRATAEYRQEMVAVLLRRTLLKAAERVQTGIVTPEGVGK